MKLVPVFFALSACLSAAPDTWSYWIQPCTPEISRATNCVESDSQLAVWALEAWARTSASRIEMKPAASQADARLRVFWAGGNLHLYGETRPVEVDGQEDMLAPIPPGAKPPVMVPAAGDHGH